jgi:AraC-like DNA-binding protein
LAKFLIDNSYFDEPLTFEDICLVQIGRRFCKEGGGVEEHLHKSWYELTVVTDGEAEIITNGRKTRVKKGDIHLSFPYDVHEIISSDKWPLRYDFFSFYITSGKYESELSRIAINCSAESRVFRDSRIPSLVSDAISEIGSDKPFSDEILSCVLNQIVVYTIRCVLFGENSKVSRVVKGDEVLSYQIMNYIDTNIFTIKSLEDISEALKYNYAYLSSLFKKTTGNTVMSYYLKKRLETARVILLEGDVKISEVSEMLGYSSPYSFSRAFREAFGISPKQYAKRRSLN